MLHLCFLVSRFSHNSSERFTPTSPSQTIISSAIPQRLAYFIPQATHVSQFDLKKKFFYCMKYIWDLAAVQAIRVTWFDLNVFLLYKIQLG